MKTEVKEAKKRATKELENLTIQEIMVLKMGVVLLSSKFQDVEDIGKELIRLHSDELSSGGFWLFDNLKQVMYCSPKLVQSLGYEADYNLSYEELSTHVSAETIRLGQKRLKALMEEKKDNIEQAIIEYTTLSGKSLIVKRAATIFYKFKEPIMVLGTHDIITEREN